MKPAWRTAACLATLLLAACGPQEPIRIGFIGELTGNSADLGEAGRNGAMLAIEQANQSGGINGRPIELLARDTGSTPATAISSAKELLDARVVAVIGTMTSGMTSALLPVHQAAQVVLLSPTATATKLSGVDDQLFRINWTTRDNAQLYARYCLERGYRRLAAAANENNRVFSESWVKELKLAFEKGGGEIVDTEYFDSGADSHLPVVEKLLQSRPDALVFVANAGDSARLAQQTRKLDKKVPLIAAEWASTDQLLELGAIPSTAWRWCSSSTPTIPRPGSPISQRYVKRFGREPAFGSVLAHDAASVLIDSLTGRATTCRSRKRSSNSGPSRGCRKKSISTPMAIRSAAPPSPSSRTAASSASSHDGPALASPHLAHPPPRGRLGDCAAHRLCLAAGLLPAAPGRPDAQRPGHQERRPGASFGGSAVDPAGATGTVAGAMADGSRRPSQRQLQQLVSQGAFSAVYHLAADGRIAQAAIASNGGKQVGELIGNDLSNDRLRRAVMQQLNTVWSDKHLSPVSRRLTVAIGAWTGSDVLIGEIPLTYILETITESSNPSAWAIWVTDGYGDIIADSEHSARVGVVNLASQPVFTQAQGGQPAISTGTFEGQPYDMAASRSGRMNWYSSCAARPG